MKITKVTLILTIIMVPFLFIQYNSVRMNHFDIREYDRVKNCFENALSDGVTALRLSGIESDYEETTRIVVNPMEGIDGFINALAYGLGVYSESGRATFMNYVPVILVVDYDGFYVYHLSQVVVDGEMTQKHLLSPKHYFTYKDEDYIYQLTLDEKVIAIDPINGRRRETSQSELALSEDVKKGMMVSQIEKALRDAMTLHNQLVSKAILYDFQLPILSKQKYDSLLKDMSMMAIFQGEKVGRRTIDLIGLENASILHQEQYAGFVSTSDQTCYYLPIDHKALEGQAIIEVFSTPKQAADKGYYPYEY